MCIFHNRTLMLWLDALKSAQQNGAWRTVFTLIIFQLLCPSLFTEYKLLYQSYGAKLMDCFCSLVAVVILSLPWNSISRETETFAAVSTFLVFYLVEVFTQLVASMRLNSLCQGKQIHGNRASYSGHAVISKQTAPLSFSQIIWGLWSISKSGWSQSLLSHGDVVGHDSDVSKSFGRMAGDVYGVTRWGRRRLMVKKKL